MPISLENGARIKIAENVITFIEEAERECDESVRITVVDTETTFEVDTRPVALLVCDIRGFSAMSEQMSGVELARMLGAWFREVGAVVAKSGGVIDKFLGDAVLAYWGSAEDSSKNCAAALEAAKHLVSLVRERTWLNGQSFQIAVALHHGRVMCSNVGLAAERDSTIIGDVVNTVFRLEDLSKELSATVLASGDFADQLELRPRLVDHGERLLRGKSQPVRVYSLAE